MKKFFRLKELSSKGQLTLREMRERDMLVNELLPLLVWSYEWSISACCELAAPGDEKEMARLVAEWERITGGIEYDFPDLS